VPAAQVTLVDVDAGKATLARELNVAFAEPDSAPRELDIVIEASGQPAALKNALQLAGFEASVVALGWYGNASVSLPLGASFHSRRLRLVSSQVGHIAPRQRPRWTHRRRLRTVMELLGASELDCLISGESSFASLPSTMKQVVSEPRGVLCHRIRYD
jgi:threonine dehydrogenase-like Zn-dependent dehydrogenase